MQRNVSILRVIIDKFRLFLIDATHALSDTRPHLEEVAMKRFPILLSPLLALGLALTAQRARSAEGETQRRHWLDSRAIGGHKLRMLSDGKSLAEARMRLLREAKESISISRYAFG